MSINDNNNNVTIERKKFTKTEKQYLRGIIHNLSLQRLTDQEIVDYLHNEKKIDISRSTATKIRNQVEQQAEKWLTELKQSRYLYIALFKERIDTIYRVEKHLWDIVNNPKDSTADRRGALAEIHNTEKTLCALYDVSRYLSSTTTLITTNEIPDPEPLPQAIVEGDDDLPGPGIGGEGAGPIVEQPTPPEKKIITPHSSPIEEQEPEEEESEADRYWSDHPDRVKPTNDNKVKFVTRIKETY